MRPYDHGLHPGFISIWDTKKRKEEKGIEYLSNLILSKKPLMLALVVFFAQLAQKDVLFDLYISYK